MHACDIHQYYNFNLPKRALHYFTKYYSRQYFVLTRYRSTLKQPPYINDATALIGNLTNVHINTFPLTDYVYGLIAHAVLLRVAAALKEF